MKKSWYVLYVILFFAAVYGIVSLLGSVMGLYLDAASILIILAFDVLGSVCIYGAGQSLGYFKAVFREEKDEEKNHQGIRYFRGMSVYTMTIGLMGFLLGILSALGNLGDKSALGPNLAVTLLTVLYAVFLNLVIFLPCRMALEKKQ